MRFDDLDTRMRKYETVNDRQVPEGMWFIARLDGKGFTGLAKEAGLERPFDERFDIVKTDTIKDVINKSGFDILYTYHQSDEISVLFHPHTDIFNRNHRKYISVLSSFFSVNFSERLSAALQAFPSLQAFFDCRIIELPSAALVTDYFSWRQADASRNALSTYCYWMLRKSSLNASQASKVLHNLSVSDKHELLFKEFKINFADCPEWQVNGVGIYLESYTKQGFNPITGKKTDCIRRRIVTNRELPYGEDYRSWLNKQFLSINPLKI